MTDTSGLCSVLAGVKVRLPAQQNVDRLTFETGRHDVEFSILVDVTGRHPIGTGPYSVGRTGCGREGSAIPKENSDGRVVRTSHTVHCCHNEIWPFVSIRVA